MLHVIFMITQHTGRRVFQKNCEACWSIQGGQCSTHWIQDQKVWFWAPAGITVVYSGAGHYTVTIPLPLLEGKRCKKTSGETKLIEGSEDRMKTCNELPKLDSNYSPFHFMIWKSTVGTLESTTLWTSKVKCSHLTLLLCKSLLCSYLKYSSDISSFCRRRLCCLQHLW